MAKKSAQPKEGEMEAYLNNRVTKHRGSHIADPHAQEHADEHTREKDSTWLRSSLAQNEHGHATSNVIFGQRGCDGKPAEQEHDDRSPHGCKYDFGRLLRAQSYVRLVIGSHNTKQHDQERNQQGCDEERNDL